MSQRSLRASVDAVVGVSLVILMGSLVVLVCWQVFTRFVLRDPSSFTEEAARFVLIWLGLVGASRALGQRMHLAIDLLSRRFSALRRLTAVTSFAICTGFSAAVLVVGGWRLVSLTLDLGQTSPALGWQLGYVYLALPVSGSLMIFYAAAEQRAPGRTEEKPWTPRA